MVAVAGWPEEAVLDAVEDPVVVLTDQARGGLQVVHANAAFHGLAGRRARIGRPLGLLDQVVAEDRHQLHTAIQDRLATEARVELADRPYRFRLTPLEAPLWVATLRDLSPLRDLEANLVSRALRDGLTGLWNRRAWTEQATSHFETSARYQRPLSVILLDLDHFKQVNDTYGHATGDAVLQAVCGACRGAIRRVDLLGRIGGEELALVAPETSLAGASTLGVRICNAVRRVRVSTPRGPLKVTISAGVAERSVIDDDLSVLMKRADGALYRAKAEGRDRVVVL